MTIKELIDELSKYNEQLEVLLQTQESEDVGVEPRVVLSHRKSGRSCVHFPAESGCERAAANLGFLSVLIINLTYGAAVGVSAIEILDLTRPSRGPLLRI